MANTQGTINLDLTKFTFTTEEIRNINELVYEGIMRLPEISAIHQMWGGIVANKEVGFITDSGLVGKAGQGCDPEPQDWNIGTRKLAWQPKEWEIYLKECAQDLKDTMVIYSMRTGTQIDDLTDTDYMNIVVEVLIGAVYKFLFRLIWLNDTDAEEVDNNEYPKAAATEQTAGSALVGTVYLAVTSSTASAVKCALADGTIIYLNGTAATGNAESGKTYYSKDTANPVTINEGGTYTENLDLDYFNIIDGLFKQLRGYVADDAKRGITIAANSQATKAAQMSGMTPQAAYELLTGMWYKAPMKLRAMKNDRNIENRPKFLVTQSIADAYEQYLIGKNLPQTFVNLTEGVQVLSILGIPVVPMPVWDEMIQSYQDLGTTFYNPHRALLTTKSVLAVGSPTQGKLFGEFDIFYDKKDRGNYILLKDMLDAKIANPDHFIYAE